MGLAIIIPDINFDDVNIGKVTPAKEVNVESMFIIEGTTNGNNIPLSIQYSPLNATDKGVTWTSSNKGIAVVNTDGVVEVQQGALSSSVTITATLVANPSITASIDLTVTFKNVLKVPFDTGLLTMVGNESQVLTSTEDLFGDSHPQWTLMLHSENEKVNSGRDLSILRIDNASVSTFRFFSVYNTNSTTLNITGDYYTWPDGTKTQRYTYGKRIANIALRRDYRAFYISIDGSTWTHIVGQSGGEVGTKVYSSDGFRIGGDSDAYFIGKIHAKLITSIDSSADSEVASFFNTYKQGS